MDEQEKCDWKAYVHQYVEERLAAAFEELLSAESTERLATAEHTEQVKAEVDAYLLKKKKEAREKARNKEGFETLQDYLWHLTEGLDRRDVYVPSNLSVQTYSDVMSPGHLPQKPTLLALAVGLRLSVDEADTLLHYAGYSLSNLTLDLIVRCHLENGIHDIYLLNDILAEEGLPILGWKPR